MDVSLRRTADGKLSLYLLNRTNLPMPDRYDFTDFIPPIGPLAVEMECAARPKVVRLMPEGEGGREGAGAGDGGHVVGGENQAADLLDVGDLLELDLAFDVFGPDRKAGAAEVGSGGFGVDGPIVAGLFRSAGGEGFFFLGGVEQPVQDEA